ncbi:hypothetical protein HPB47_006825 [Ixodes persulcatus]|uniref:Uncharacterized protein n=1 Tax=Ixodes persulcatus TaxID=34615 RepID=A0AC60P9A7_IXOPE|nr:hypothetical protein HPB47_006825 [Ixodes persulcatus]
MLKNMSDKSRAELLNLANASWEKADVRFIPKPGKPPHVDNLHPISLTSCVGKVVERMVFKRLQRHLDVTDQMPPTMNGIRRHLSTQDVSVQLHELVIKKAKTPTQRAILALDLKGAFDYVAPESILRNLRQMGCGKRIFKYVQDFLSNRSATIEIGEEKSKPIALGDRGTSQVSVLSPLLFNLAILPLRALLQGIEGKNRALYADDITVWTSRAVEKTVHEFAKSCGLSCSPQKSELLVIKPRKKKGEQENVRITIDGTNITPTTQARILDVIFQNNGKVGASIDKIKTSAGRRVPAKLGRQEAERKETGPLPRLWAHKIDSKPLPRNMRPGRNDGRRAARIVALSETLDQIEEEEEWLTLYTDASLPTFSSKATLAVTTKDVLVTCGSIKTYFPEVAEEAAIALALAQPKGNELSHQFAREMDHRVEEVCDFVKPIPSPLTIPTTPPHPSSSLSERWETLLTSPLLEHQLVLISRGQAAKEAYGSREEGTTSIDGV